MKKPDEDPTILLFDEIILAKKNRGRSGVFSKSNTHYLSDTADHLWVSAAVPTPSAKLPEGADYHSIISRTPAKLDPTLMKEPRVIQGAPRLDKGSNWINRRKPVSSLMENKRTKLNMNLAAENIS